MTAATSSGPGELMAAATKAVSAGGAAKRWKGAMRSPLGITAAVLLAGVLLLAVVAPLIWQGRAEAVQSAEILQGPSSAHPVGTDLLGRDILARVLVATRLSVGLALLATAIGVTAGLLLGTAPVLLGRRAGRWIGAFINIAVAFPSLLLALFFAVIFGVGAKGAVLAIGFATAPAFARLTQTMAVTISGRDFIAAARVAGIGRLRILVRHVLPNIAEPLVVSATMAAGAALLSFASLSFLGLGVQAPSYDWGRLLGEGLAQIYVHPAGALAAGVAVVLAAMAFNLAGEAVARAIGLRSAQTHQRTQTAPTHEKPRAEPEPDGPEKPLLAVENLHVSFGAVTPVRGVSLTVRKGEAIGIVGESGSGKSLTALAIAQLIERPGRVRADRLEFLGTDLRERSTAHERTDVREHSEASERSTTAGRSNARERSESIERADMRKRSDVRERSDASERADAGERSDASERADAGERSDVLERSDLRERPDVLERADVLEHSDVLERSDVPENSATSERADVRERSDMRNRSDVRGRSDASERADAGERSDVLERSDLPENSATSERADLPEHSDVLERSDARERSVAAERADVRERSIFSERSDVRERSGKGERSSARDGSELSKNELRRLLGTSLSMVFQDPMTSLNPTQRVGGQLAEVVREHQGADRRTAWRRAVDRLAAVRIPGAERRARQLPHEFSGGMRQRAMIGMGVMANPALIIADEPTTALDVTVQRQVLQLIASIRAAERVGLLFISHDVTVVGQVCDRVLVMYAGRIVEDLPTDALLHDARHPYTRALVAAVPDMTTDRTKPLAVIPGRPPDPHDVPAGCPYAPRCPLATDQCRRQDPALTTYAAGRRVACWHADLAPAAVPDNRAATSGDEPVVPDSRAATAGGQCVVPGDRAATADGQGVVPDNRAATTGGQGVVPDNRAATTVGQPAASDDDKTDDQIAAPLGGDRA